MNNASFSIFGTAVPICNWINHLGILISLIRINGKGDCMFSPSSKDIINVFVAGILYFLISLIKASISVKNMAVFAKFTILIVSGGAGTASDVKAEDEDMMTMICDRTHYLNELRVYVPRGRFIR